MCSSDLDCLSGEIEGEGYTQRIDSIRRFERQLTDNGGTIGPWIAAIVCAVVLARCVFADFSLDDDAEAVVGAATAGATDAEGEEARRG